MKYQTENIGGKYDFRCRAHEGWTIEPHIHEYTELLYCRRGRCETEINRQAISLSEKQFLWVPPNEIHRYRAPQAAVICAVFSNDFIPLFTQLTANRRPVAQALDAAELAPVFENLPNRTADRPLGIAADLTLIAAKVAEQATFEPTPPADGDLCRTVILYVAAHFKEDLSLAGLAARFHYNEKYLSHALHSATGLHFSQLLAMYRVEYAQTRLLDSPSLSVSEIAYQSGFTALNSFNRQFKALTGFTPTAYRATRAGQLMK